MQQLAISSFGSTNAGKRREINEDYFIVDDQRHLYIVADGMGGHNAGEQASRMASNSFSEFFSNSETKQISDSLKECASKVNELVYSMSESDINLQGMGTTIVVCFCSEDTAHICHAGDSRAYLFRENILTQITEDHSAVALMVKQGYITREEAEDHPMKNRITRAIGTMREIDVDYNACALQKGDQILLCTDGLSNMVREQELTKILGQTQSLKEKILLLIQMANSNGGHDNITAILIEAT